MVLPLWVIEPVTPFCNCINREGFLSFKIALISFNLFERIWDFAFNTEYLKLIFPLTTSSGEAIKSRVNNSRNLYSIFWMKSSLAWPSLCIKKTAK